MANELRAHFNFVSGALGVALSDIDTVISSPGLATLGVIDATNYAALIIESEVMWITAHTAAATTATVVRGKEGSAAVAHALNTIWVHGPTVIDIEDGPFRPGDIKWSGRDDLPNSRWAWADGSEILGTTYPQLSAELGTGAGSRFGAAAVGNIKLPDFRRKFITMKAASGTGSTLGGVIGSNNAVAISHGHTQDAHDHGMGGASATHGHRFRMQYTGISPHNHAVGILFPAEGADGGAPGAFSTTDGQNADHIHDLSPATATTQANGVAGTEKNIPEAIVCNAMVYLGLS